MSTTSGIGSKGEKNKSKYKGIDINNLYKGKTVETQKSTGMLKKLDGSKFEKHEYGSYLDSLMDN